METKEIFAVIIAVLAVIIVISVLSMITKRSGATKQDSSPEITEVPPITAITLETNIWDVLREQNTTTVLTEETLPESPDGTDIIAGTDLTGDDPGLVSIGSTPTDFPLQNESQLPGSVTESVSTDITFAPITEQQVQTFILQLP